MNAQRHRRASRSRRRRSLPAALLLLCLSGLAAAAHITDKLVVGLYAQPSLEGEPQRLLTTGTPLEVLKRGKGVLQVRLADDTRGWVEARYVTDEKPAAMMLLEARAEIRRLKAELDARQGRTTPLPSLADARAEQQLAAARARIQALEKDLAELPALRRAAQERDRLKARIDELRRLLGVQVAARQEAETARRELPLWKRYLPWIVAGLLALLGFAAGVAFIDWRIRKRYGGFRL